MFFWGFLNFCSSQKKNQFCCPILVPVPPKGCWFNFEPFVNCNLHVSSWVLYLFIFLLWSPPSLVGWLVVSSFCFGLRSFHLVPFLATFVFGCFGLSTFDKFSPIIFECRDGRFRLLYSQYHKSMKHKTTHLLNKLGG